MLPQPGRSEGYEAAVERASGADLRVGTGEPTAPRPECLPPAEAEPDGAVPFTTVTALVRTPITTMPPLFERARELLLRHWTHDPPRTLHAIELTVSSFEQPVQLAFAELNRLDGIGRLRGMDTARRRAFEQAEEALATRYGDTSFRRLAHLDPANILTERRFRWRSYEPRAAARGS
jgi:hypothetical protein